MAALVLNATFEALGVIADRRAVTLVYEDRVDVVADSDRLFSSQRQALFVPSVVRLRTYVKVPYRSLARLTRRNVMARDDYRCAYCTGRGTTIDHIIPRGKGGPHSWLNVVAACEGCNNRKADHLLSKLGWELRFTPYEPSAVDMFRWGPNAADPAWAEWLPKKIGA